MAYDIGPRIGIEGEAEYRAQMNSIITQTKTLHAEMKTMKSAWDSDTSAKQKAAQQTKMLKEQIALQEQKLAQANNMLDKATAKYGENSNQALRWRQAVANARTELNNLNNELRNTPNQLQAMGQQMQEVGSKIQNVGKTVTSVGKTMTTHVTAPIVGVGAASVKMASDFETSMAKVSSIADDSEVSYESMRQAVLKLSNDTGVAASDIAENVYQAISAGQDTASAVEFVGRATKLAKAGFSESGQALDVLTTILNAYGLEANEAADISDKLITTQNLGKTTVAELAENMGKVIPTAAAYGVKIDQLGAGYVTLTKNGIKTAETTTYLNSMIDELGKSGSKSANILKKKTGKSFQELMESGYTLTDALEIVQTGADEAGVSISDMFTNKNARKAANTLTQHADVFTDALTSMGNAAGTTDAAFSKVANTSAAEFARVLNEVKNTGIDLGQTILTTAAPALKDIAEKIKEGCHWFQELDDSQKEQIIKFAAVAAAAGPVLTVSGNLITAGGAIYGTVGKVVEIVGGLTAAAEGASAGVGLMGAAMGALPLVGVVAGVGLAVGGVIALNKAVGGGKDGISQLNAEMTATVGSAEKARGALDKEVDSVQKMNDNHQASLEKTEAAARLAEKYADELTDLAGKANKSTSEQAKMKALVGKLNSIYPELGLAIDDTTGELNMSTEALKKNIKQLKEQAKAAAYNKILQEEMDKLVEVETKVIEAEDKKAEVMVKAGEAASKQAEIQAALKAEQDELTAAEENYRAVMADSTATTDEKTAAEIRWERAQSAANDTSVILNGTMIETASALEQCATAQQSASEEAGKLDASIASANEESNALTETMARTQERLDQYTESLGLTSDASDTATEASDTFGTAIEGAADSADSAGSVLGDVAKEISESWDKTYKNTKESVMGQKGLFDKLEEAEKTSVEQMANNLHKHVESYQNWNTNAKTLMESERYATDKNFRAMVNSIVSAGTDMAPELQAIVDAFQSGDTSLETIVQDYGTMSTLASDMATTTANAATAADYGLDAMNQAIGTDFATAKQTAATGTLDMAGAIGAGVPPLQYNINSLSGTYDNLYMSIAARTGKLEPLAANDVNGLASGLGKGNGAVQRSVNGVTKEVGKLPTNVSAQKAASQKSATDLVKSTANSIQGQKETFSNTAKSTGTEAKQVSLAINAQKAGAASSAKTLVSGVTTAVNGSKASVSAASKAVGAETKQVSQAIDAQKAGAVSSAKALATAVKSALDGQKGTIKTAGTNLGKAAGEGVKSGADGSKGSASSAGKNLGGALVNGLNDKKGSARSAGGSVARAGKDGITGVSTSSARTWGQHLGQNLVDGIRSKIAAARAASRALANAAASNIKHSTPKEGPLRHDDVWGMHLAQNFADAMHKGIPVIKAQSAQLAQAANVSTYVDPLDVSGRGALGTTIRQSVDLSNMPNIDPEAIYNAVRAGTEGQSITLQIGERELGRVLRDMGVQFA